METIKSLTSSAAVLLLVAACGSESEKDSNSSSSSSSASSSSASSSSASSSSSSASSSSSTSGYVYDYCAQHMPGSSSSSSGGGNSGALPPPLPEVNLSYGRDDDGLYTVGGDFEDLDPASLLYNVVAEYVYTGNVSVYFSDELYVNVADGDYIIDTLAFWVFNPGVEPLKLKVTSQSISYLCGSDGNGGWGYEYSEGVTEDTVTVPVGEWTWVNASIEGIGNYYRQIRIAPQVEDGNRVHVFVDDMTLELLTP